MFRGSKLSSGLTEPVLEQSKIKSLERCEGKNVFLSWMGA